MATGGSGAVEVGTAYVSVLPSTKGFNKAIDSSLSKTGTGVGSKIGTRIDSGMSKVLKTGAAATGVAAGAILATSITKGLGRLNAIEQAKVKFEALGHSAKAQAGLMDDVTASVKGTAFATSDAADAAAMALAGGIKPGKELTGVLKTMGDSASFANKPFSEVAPIFTKAINQGRVMGDTLMQLEKNAIPATQSLGKHLGKTAEEIRDMASKGEISFEDLQAAMDASIGGQALKAGETFTGSLANIGAAMARFGETLLQPVFTSAPAIFSSLGGVFDEVTDAVAPAMEQIGNMLAPALARVADLVETRLAPALGEGAARFGDLAVKLAEAAVDPANWQWVADALESVATSARNAGPAIGELVAAMARVAAVVSVHVWVAFANVLEALVPIIENVLVPILEKVGDIAEKHPKLVQGLIMAWMGFRVVGGLTKTLGSVAKSFVNVLGKAEKAATGVKAFGQSMKLQKSLAAAGGKSVGNVGAAFGVMGTKMSPIMKKFPMLSGLLKTVASGAMTLFKWIKPLGMTLLRFAPVVGIFVTLGTALWAFFTKTEMGRNIWSGFIDLLKSAWEWIQGVFAPVWSWLGDVISGAWEGIKTAFSTFVEFLQGAWEGFIKPVLDGFMFGIKILGAVVGTIILGSILVAWNLLSATISALWEGVVKPVWDAFAAVITWLWTTVIMPVFEFIKNAFMAVATTLFMIWSTIIKVVWDAFAAAVTWIWNTIIMPIFNLIKLAFQAVGFVFQTVWNTIIKPAWDALGAGISFVWNNIVSPVWNAMKAALQALGNFFKMVWNNIIKPAWDALGTGISWVVDNVVRPAFDRIKSALDSVKNFFSTVVDGIRTIWDQLKGHVARPINFVIDTVWNNGLVTAWNTIAGFLPGLPEASTLAPVAFATGGAVFGPGTATSDSILARLSDGEHVLTAADVKALGGHNMIYALRALIKRGEPFSWDMATGLATRPKDAIDKFGSERSNGDIGLMPGFKDGGAVARRAIKKDDTRPAWMDQLANGHRAAKMRDGNPYTWGFEDCSGYMSMIADAIINGGDGVRKWATGSFPGGQPWDPGLSEGFSVGVHDNPGGPGGGHTAGTLTGVDNYGTVNVESGGSHGRVAYGGPAAGADDPQWDGVSPGRYHLAIGADGSFESAGGPSPEQQRAILKKKIQEIIDKAMDPIADAMGAAIGDPPPHWLGIPPAALDETKTGAIDTAFDFVDNLGDKLRAAYDLAKDVVSSVTTVVRNLIPGFAEGGAVVSGLWRDNGGYIPTGQSVVTNETGRPEAVLNWRQVDRIRDILASLGSVDEFKKLADVVGRMATTGIYDPRAAQFGIDSDDDELVQALWFARDEWMKSALAFDEILRGAGEKAATGYRDEFLDFFGFGEIFNAGMEVYDAFNPKPGQTSDSSVTPVSTDPGYTPASGAVSQGQELVYGDPNVTFETSEVELETKMPDLDSSGTPGSGPVKDQVKEAFRPKGWDVGPMWDATDWIVGKESDWNPLARNPSSDAFGLFQFLGATKQTYLPDENPNPKIQGEAGARYITDRYGDPLKAKAFWEANGWYDKGGWLMPGLTLTNNETGKPEAVLNPSQWASITRQTDLVADLAEDGGSSGPLVVIENLHATSEEDAMRAAMREARRANRANSLAGGWG